MTEKERRNNEIELRSIAMLLKKGYNEEQINKILINNLSKVLWKKMTSKQKNKFNNNFEQFRLHNLNLIQN